MNIPNRESGARILGFCLAVVALLLRPSIPADASVVDVEEMCKIYVANETAIPIQVQVLMKRYSATTASYACMRQDGQITEYSVLTSVWRRPFGVCEFEKASTAYLQGKGFFPPQMYMAKIPSECPQQNDSRYIPANGVSEGLFVQILNFFDRLAASPEALDSAFRDNSKQEEFPVLRSNILARRVHVQGISLAPFFLSADISGYEVSLKEAPTSRQGWLVSVDLTSTGFKITHFSRVYH